ncbi:MAG: thermonuclease family protein [Rickettsiales bacterium]|jgi:endonuclease YncB( thermonuclease family)|nr:thermonuclease family protein [Rickettsiales bacterium]
MMKKILTLSSFFILHSSLSAAVPDLTATVNHMIDGDTFAAAISLENGAEVSASVRLMNIDAPELHGECELETEMANKSKARLGELIPVGTKVILSKIKDDKYLGRVDAFVRDASGRDIGRIMIDENMAVAYGGGRRGSWCGAKGEKK